MSKEETEVPLMGVRYGRATRRRRLDRLLVPMAVMVLGLSGCTADAPSDRSAESRHALDTVTAIGTLDGSNGIAFGRIGAIRPQPDSSLIVIDALPGYLYWLERDGRPRALHDALGQGPGELSSPRDAVVLPNGELGVLETLRQRLSWFTLAEDGFRFQRSTPVASRTLRICAAGDRVFVAGVTGGSTVHELDPTGSLIRSFGHIPEPDGMEAAGMMREMAEGALGPDHLLCLADREMIVTFQGHGPQLTAYSLNGEHLWDHTFDWMVSERLELEVGSTGGAWRWVGDPQLGSHRVVSLLRWDDDGLLVQIEHIPPDPGEGETGTEQEARSVQTLLMELGDGEIRARVADFPRLRAGEHGRFFAVEAEPYPRILVLELEARE